MKILKLTMLSCFFIFIASTNCSENLNLLVKDSLLGNLREIEIIDANCSDAVVKLVKDGNDKLYVLKQINHEEISEQFLLIRDLVASHFGAICEILLNKVLLISAKQNSDIKFYTDRAATLHFFCKGKNLEKYKPDFLSKEFCLQQEFCNPGSIWQKIPIKEDEQGLTRNVIESMTIHEDLPKIVAFDTFIGNSDRSFPNIFYNSNQNNFYGIDQAAAFNRKNLPKIAYDRLKELYDRGYFNKCNSKIIEALKIYQETLKILHEKIRPKHVSALFEIYSQNIELEKSESSFTKKRSEWHTKNFKKNWKSTIDLIELLNKILEMKH